MKRVALLVAAGFVVGGGATACKKEVGADTKNTVTDQKSGEGVIAELGVDELERQLAAGAAQAVDANGDLTRKRMGTIPGAVLLSDYEAFSLGELPADKAKPLVFYCANEYCGASHEAAKRARFAGHTNVKVLPAGRHSLLFMGPPGSGKSMLAQHASRVGGQVVVVGAQQLQLQLHAQGQRL